MMQLTEHFSFEALTASDTAARLGIDNRPPAALILNLLALANGLEQVRVALGGRDLRINSGYRCPELNARLGGAKRSRHMEGLAADILCSAFGAPLEVCRAIVAAGVKPDQVIHEFGKWCHVSFAAPGTEPRGDLLTIASAIRGYEEGLHPVS
jgi:hypothetical protein